MNLRLLQLGDSALPIGGYSHSWGLEAAIDQGVVHDAASLEQWGRLWLKHSIGPLEGVVVAAVCRAADRGDWPPALRANDLLWASLLPPTLRNASRDLGEQLLGLAEVWPWASKCVGTLRGLMSTARGLTHWHHAPVFAALAAVAGARPEEAIGIYLHQAVQGILGAGVRAVPIGHTHGQQVLVRLHEDIESLAATLADRELESAGSCCPAYEILCHAQSQLYTRIFRS
jgi:urease accessory protein